MAVYGGNLGGSGGAGGAGSVMQGVIVSMPGNSEYSSCSKPGEPGYFSTGVKSMTSLAGASGNTRSIVPSSKSFFLHVSI